MYLIDLISNLSILAPLILGAFFVRKYDRVITTFYILVVLSAIIEAGILYTSWNSINNLAYFHVYTFIEFGFITAIYYQLITTYLVRMGLIVFSILFVLLSLYSLIYWEGLNQFNGVQSMLEGIYVPVLIILYGIHLFKAYDIDSLETHPYFWLSVGYFVYFGCSLFLFGVMNKVIEHNIDIYWSIHGCVNIFLHFMYALTLWIGRKI